MSYDPDASQDGLPVLSILPPEFDKEDEHQEKALAALEGRKPRFYHPQRRRDLGYGIVTPGEAEPLWTDPITLYDYDAADRLTDWLLEQSEIVQLATIKYLEDPDEPRFQNLLRLIGRHQQAAQHSIRPEVATPRPLLYTSGVSKPSLIQLIIRALPAELDSLYAMARREHAAKRPEAAVRQALRRLQEEGKVLREGNRILRVDQSPSTGGGHTS